MYTLSHITGIYFYIHNSSEMFFKETMHNQSIYHFLLRTYAKGYCHKAVVPADVWYKVLL